MNECESVKYSGEFEQDHLREYNSELVGGSEECACALMKVEY